MINAVLRLEFEHVFPDEEQKDIIKYLEKISKNILLNIIGFSNTTPLPNFDNFITNPGVRSDIISRVIKYSKENNIKKKPLLITRKACLKLAEIILSNREKLLDKNDISEKNIDVDEINLFKSFLVVNQEVDKSDILVSSDDSFERMVDFMISSTFPSAELGLMENNDWEFGKLLYSTLIRFEMLIDFLKSNNDYYYLEKSLFKYFNLESSDELILQVKKLFIELLKIKQKNRYKIGVKDKNSLLFLNSLVSNKITKDEDFTYLKNYPLYKIDDNIFSVIDYFFVIDKFIKSVKFILKKSFEDYHDLKPKDRSFFNFYNTKFSEEYLMLTILDKVYWKNYFVKKVQKSHNKNEPDYYVRHNKRIYLFENKDILIAKEIKSSGDIEKINNVLKNKFLKTQGTAIGIGQLVASIKKIVEQNFEYDDVVNIKNNYTIYPILLVSDRIFEIFGINYRLNKWYIELVKIQLGVKYNPSVIKNLTLIDIDTVIYWLPHLKKSDNNFRNLIDKHLKAMSERKIAKHKDPFVSIEIARKNILNQLIPISHRFEDYEFPNQELFNKLKESIEK